MGVDTKNCIMIGIGATDEKLRTNDGEILFATPNESVLFSEGKIYHNGQEVASVTNAVVESIRLAFVAIKNQHDGPDDTVDAYGKPNGWCWQCWKSQRIMEFERFFPPANESMTEGDEGYHELFGGREPA